MHALRRSLILFVLLAAVPFTRAQTATWSNLDHALGASFTELNSVAFGNGVFLAIKSVMTGGTLHYATSTDGSTWTARSISTTITSSGSAQRVRFLDGRFLVMPIGLSGSAGVALSVTSTDGLTWTTSTIGTTTTSPDEMDFGNGRVLAVGSNGFFLGSTNFTTWTAQSTSLQGAFAIQDVAFGNGRWFVTTNGGGEVATSTDGINFTKVNGLSATGGFRVEYGNNTWFFYSQQNNAVSSDGVNFTPVTRTANVTPGGTGTIRFVNGRFLAYGPSTFQSSTDGQAWTDFGAFPSLGSGFIFSSIYDFAYGNGKYVAVGSRGFPPTTALIYVSTGPTQTDPGTEPVAGTFTVAFRGGVTALPGTTAPITNAPQGYALHNGGVVIATSNSTGARTSLVMHKSGVLSTLLDGTGGMPGGGNIHMMELGSDGSVIYAAPRSVSVNFASNSALVKVENGVVSTVIENSNTIINRGSFFSSELITPSVTPGAVAFVGKRGNQPAYIFRRQGNATTTVVEAGVTTQPNGAGTGKFENFGRIIQAADGRIFFDGYNAGGFSEPNFRRGLYVAQNGAIGVVADSATLLPGTTTKFNFVSIEPTFAVSPDGTKAILTGGNGDYSTETSERHGIYLYANGALTVVADTAMTVGGAKFTYISTGAVTNDGTVIFYGSAGNSTDLYRARNGTIERFVDGGSTSNSRSPQGLWIHDGQVFFYAMTSSLQRALFRKAVDGTGAADIAINLATHPDFKAIDARSVEDVQFANDQVLIHVGAVHSGLQRSALLYGAASTILGTSTPSSPTPQSQAVAVGGSATLSTSATGTVQWQRNGANVTNGTNSSITLSNIQPADAGIYSAIITNGGTTTTQSAIVGVSTTSKLVGAGTEFPNITHPNGNVFDQLLLETNAAAFTADSAQNQITRLSFVDLTNDIVQVEFSGAGTVSIVLEGSSGPAAPVNYNQSTTYMKGHAGIVVTGANETTNLSVFSVGRGNAVNQALFKDSVTYDGIADIAFVAIQSTNGKFGGLRTANASYWNTKGLTGIYAPDVQFTGPVYAHDINAQQDATPVFILGSATGNTWITGGDLAQANAKALQIGGLTQLHMKDGTTSHFVSTAATPTQLLAAKTNQGRLEQNGADVTGQIIVSSGN